MGKNTTRANCAADYCAVMAVQSSIDAAPTPCVHIQSINSLRCCRRLVSSSDGGAVVVADVARMQTQPILYVYAFRNLHTACHNRDSNVP